MLQKSTKCFDHSQLAVEENQRIEKLKPSQNERLENKTNGTAFENVLSKDQGTKSSNDNKCDTKTCTSKKRTVSISSQIKTTHNKSEIGLKNKKCSLTRKDNNSAMKSEVIPNIAAPLSEHILLKTF